MDAEHATSRDDERGTAPTEGRGGPARALRPPPVKQAAHEPFDEEEAPALFVDPALTVRAFTRAAGPLFRLRAGDIGKSVAEIAAAIRDPWLLDDARAVIAAQGSIQREVRRDGLWRLRRSAPGRAPRGGVDGVVVTSVAIGLRAASGMAGRDAPDDDASLLAARAIQAVARRVARLGADPYAAAALLAAVEAALGGAEVVAPSASGAAALRIARLSPRQREIMARVVDGAPTKVIAFELGVSPRTVENHRALLMRRLGVRSLPALVRLALAAETAS